MKNLNRAKLLPFSIAMAAMLLSSSALPQEEFAGLRIVNIVDEPRHRTVHLDGDIRVLDVQINPGDQTLPHTHDGAIMYTFISNGDGPLNGRVSSNTDYVKESFTHQVENAGPGLFRIIAMANYGPPVERSDLPQGLADPTLENPWFRSYRVELAPGEASAMFSHQNPVLIVQVNEGVTHVSREDGITAELDAMGDWAWRTPASRYQVRNVGNSPVALVINEARR